jgi:hypothetical protein
MLIFNMKRNEKFMKQNNAKNRPNVKNLANKYSSPHAVREMETP